MLPPLLADANVAEEVIEFLRVGGVEVVTVQESGSARRRDTASSAPYRASSDSPVPATRATLMRRMQARSSS